jgi:hypothetical protein
MFASMAHNTDILGLLQCLVVSFVVSLVSWSMGHCGRTGERLEMVAARATNSTPVQDEVDLWVA